MRYLVTTQHLGLWYPKLNTCSLVGYFDVDFAGSQINNNKKSTSEGCQFFGHSLVSLQSRKQNNITLSTTKT